MKKAIITTRRQTKIDAINNIEGKKLIVMPMSRKGMLESINGDFETIFSENLSNAVLFLDTQTKVNDKVTVVVVDCMRYNEFNNTKYNKIYQLTDIAKNVLMIDNFPFVFDHRNIYVMMKMLGVNNYHPKQFYDDNFFTEMPDGRQVQANSFEAIYPILEPCLFVDLPNINYVIHEWAATAEEMEYYENFKRKLIYEENYPKVKVVTWLQGESNRFNSKFEKLLETLEGLNCKPQLIYNWDRGINEHKPKIPFIVEMGSYHQQTPNTSCDVFFFETIISQRIKFYDKLAQYANCKLHFFMNSQLGADRIIAGQNIELVKSLNEFLSFQWKKI